MEVGEQGMSESWGVEWSGVLALAGLNRIGIDESEVENEAPEPKRNVRDGWLAASKQEAVGGRPGRWMELQELTLHVRDNRSRSLGVQTQG